MLDPGSIAPFSHAASWETWCLRDRQGHSVTLVVTNGERTKHPVTLTHIPNDIPSNTPTSYPSSFTVQPTYYPLCHPIRYSARHSHNVLMTQRIHATHHSTSKPLVPRVPNGRDASKPLPTASKLATFLIRHTKGCLGSVSGVQPTQKWCRAFHGRYVNPISFLSLLPNNIH